MLRKARCGADLVEAAEPTGAGDRSPSLRGAALRGATTRLSERQQGSVPGGGVVGGGNWTVVFWQIPWLSIHVPFPHSYHHEVAAS
jgi:hypothetical protein